MSADAQPSVPPRAPDQTGPARPKRLPGLWIICVLLGLSAAFDVALALCATTLGAFIFGALAALQLAMAAVLWVRVRAGWYAVMAALGVGFVLALASTILDPGRTGILMWPVCLVFGVYLWISREHFLRAEGPRPPVLSGPGVSALAVVLVIGGGLLALLAVDDARQSFPKLEVQVPVPPEDDNGFVLIEQMRAKWPLHEDQQLNVVIDGLPRRGGTPSLDWVAEARGVVQRYDDCRAEVRELVRKPHCVEVPRLRGGAWAENLHPWLGSARALAHLLQVSAAVLAADRNWGEAMDEAHLEVALGGLVCKESTGLLQSLVGMSVTRMGLSSLRNVAATVPDAALLKAHLGPPLSEQEFRNGINLCLAGEFQGVFSVFEDMSRGRHSGFEVLRAHGSGPPPPGFLRRMRDTPLIKKNMTYNMLGGLFSRYNIQGDTYASPGPDPSVGGTFLERAVRSVGYIHLVRNPTGDILTPMLAPAMARSQKIAFEAIAEARMTQLFIALRCHQLEHGRLPESLDDLAPDYLKAVPLDPFTGGPFGYEPAGEKPRIWSVGPDQKTDPPGAKYPDDVVVPLGFGGS